MVGVADHQHGPVAEDLQQTAHLAGQVEGRWDDLQDEEAHPDGGGRLDVGDHSST